MKYGYAETVAQMVQRLKFDILYIENMSLAMDFRVLLYTLKIIVEGRGKSACRACASRHPAGSTKRMRFISIFRLQFHRASALSSTRFMKKTLRFLPFLWGALATSAQAQNAGQLIAQTRLIVRLRMTSRPQRLGKAR